MNEGRRYTITLEGMPPSGNQRKRMHHMRLYRIDREWATWAYCLLRDAGCAQRMQRARVRLTFVHALTHIVRDEDNCISSAKGIIDGIRDVCLIDDDPAHMELVVEQRVEKGKPRRVVIEVEELEDEGK